MSIKNQKGFTKIFTKQKKPFYQFTNELVNNEFNLKIYYLLIVIEHLQIIAYQCHQKFQYKALGVEYFRKLTQFLNPQYYLKHTRLMDYFIPFSFALGLVHLSFLAYSYYRHKQKSSKKDTIQAKKQVTLHITHYMTVVIVTVLTTPIFLTSLLAFYCHSDSPYHQGRTCYDTYHLFLIIMALINILWMVAINVYYFLFYFTKNPFAYKNFLAVSSSLWNLLKFAIKIVPPGYLIFDEVLDYNILFVFGIAAGLLGFTAISRVLYPYTRYNKYIQKVMVSIQIVSITVSLMFIMQAFFTEQQGNAISFIVSFIISVPLTKAAYTFIMYLKEQTILEINQFQKDNTDTIQQLLTYLIVELEDDNVSFDKKRFFKVVKLHNDQCENVQCACHQYLTNYQQDQKYYQNKQLIYKIFLKIIDSMVQVNKKAYSLLMLKSYIQYHQLNNAIKAAFIISKIMHQKISFFQQYSINAFLYQVGKNFQDTTNMQTYRVFSQHLIKFQQQAITLAQYYAQFWQQIGQQNSSLWKVMSLLKKAKRSKQIIDQEFQILHSIYPTNTRILQIYKQLYKEVLIDYEQFMKYQNMYKDSIQQKQESKLVKLNFQMKFAPNQDLIVINTSVNVANDIFHGGCEIISVTNNVYKVLGYSSQDLIGKNINRFLPKIYTDFHDDIIDNYLSKSKEQLKPREVIIFPVNSSGYLVECAMVNKIMPSLEHGVNIISFLLNSKVTKESLIIYDQRTGLVDSMSEKAQTLLLGKKLKKNSISIPDHITDILPIWDYVKEQTTFSKKRSSQQLQCQFSNVYLYRSDGPADSKYVKIITFQQAFHEKMFTMNDFFDDQQPAWMGFQTLVQNSRQKSNMMQKTDKNHADNFRQGMSQSPNPILPRSTNHKPSTIVEDVKMYEPLPKWYSKVYLGIEIALLIGLLAVIIYNYARTISYYNMMRNDIVIKENIADCSDLLMEGSHTASQYVYSGGDPVILAQVDVDNATTDLKEVVSIGQSIYQQIVQKQNQGQIFIDDIMLDVQYFKSPTTTVIKTQTVTDASYQMVLYLLEIYGNSNPLMNLPNNVLFVFRNCLNISDQFLNLNEILTNNLFKKSSKRNNDIIAIVAGILTIFFVSLIWESIYKLIIDSKVNNVIQIYESVPIEQLQKYPMKCHNFIKYVCPVQISKSNLHTTVKSIKNLGNAIIHQVSRQQMQIGSVQLQDEQEEETEYISFSNSLSLKNIIFQGILFLLIFSVLFIVSLTTENSVIKQNLFEVGEWNKMTRCRSSIIRTVYLLNEFKNRASQWNQTQLQVIKQQFYQSISTIQYLLKATTQLDSYLSQAYGLIEESVYIMKNTSVTSDQFVLNEYKVSVLSDRLLNNQIDGVTQANIESTISGFLSMLQLIFIGQIILFLLYAVLYIPRSYKAYIQKNDITQMMYNTLGFKLQNIAKANYKNK